MNSRKQGANQEAAQEMNRSLVLRLLRSGKSVSRVQLARESGLNQSTITNIVHELMGWGLVEETGSIGGSKGRRSIGLAINGDAGKVIGIRLARKSVALAVYGLDGVELAHVAVRVAAEEGAAAVLETIINAVRKQIQAFGEGSIRAIGIAAPGPLLRHEGRVALMTYFPGWDKINIVKRMEEEFALPVLLEHDAKAGAQAVWWYGSGAAEAVPAARAAGSEGEVLVFIAAGYGIGAGVVADGELFRGAFGIAGEIGHTSIDFRGRPCECGHRGCLERYASASALLESLAHTEYRSLEQMWQGLRNGDGQVEEAVRLAASYLAAGIINLINSFNPSRIVIGDEWIAAEELLLDAINEAVGSSVLPDISRQLQIELAAPGQDPVLIGAATVAINELLAEPSRYFP